MTVTVASVAPDRVSVSSPYHPDFAPKAKKLGGRWDGAKRVWTFDTRDEERVRALCKSVYGTDGSPVDSLSTVTVRITAKESLRSSQSGIYFAGRCVAHATGRDSGARLGAGVVCLSGKYGSGGSVKNWNTVINDGSVFEVRDVPAGALPDTDGWAWEAEMVTPSGEHRKVLEAERVALQARLTAVEAELLGLPLNICRVSGFP